MAPFSRLRLQKFNLAKTPPIILPSLRNRRNLDGYYQIERNVISDLYLTAKEAQKMKVISFLNECIRVVHHIQLKIKVITKVH